MTARAVISAGSNLGDRLATLTRGLELLTVHPQVTISAISGTYETDPVGGPEQGDFLNLVTIIDTELAPLALLGLLHVVEAASDRVRAERWGPRTLDLDLIAYDQLVDSNGPPVLPHPRAHERAFVLVPWLDVDADAALPGHGRVAALADELDTSGVRARPELRVQL